MNDVLLKFNGHTHDAGKVLGKASRPVEVMYKDINTDLSLVEYIVAGVENSAGLGAGTTVFIHFNGQYVPLMGRNKCLIEGAEPERLIKGMLITSVALKATRVEGSKPLASGPATIKTPTEGVQVSQPEGAALKNFDALRGKFNTPPKTSTPRPMGDADRRIAQNYGGRARPESATGSSLRSRSPYRRP